MRVLYQINYRGGLGADQWISSGYQHAFEELGHEFFYCTFTDDLGTVFHDVRPDLCFLFPGEAAFKRRNWPLIQEARAQGTKIFLFVDHTFQAHPETLSLYRDASLADVYWGYIEQEWMEKFTAETGRDYVTLPLAADRKYHFPTSPVAKYACDIAFLGANLPLKQKAFQRLLLPLRRRYKVRIYGQDWTLEDRFLHFIASGLQRLSVKNLSTWINKRRIAIPQGEENKLYASAKISVNIHEEGPTLERHVMLNERGFKIPACGGFEICDHNLALRRYFTEREVVMAKDDEDWFRKIDYYLHHKTERRAIKEAGTRRALQDHTYHERVKKVLALAGF